MKKNKFLTTTALLLALSFSQAAFASSPEISSELLYTNPISIEESIILQNEESTSNITDEDGIESYSTSIPSSSVDISGSKMRFRGNASSTDLYTDDCFTGVSRVTIEVTNYRSSNVTVAVYKKSNKSKVETFNFLGNSTQGYSLSGLDSNESYYLRFYYPCDFSGTVYDL